MKQYLWLVGLVSVVIGATLYAVSASSSNTDLWVGATFATVLGGGLLIIAGLAYHTPAKKPAKRK